MGINKYFIFSTWKISNDQFVVVFISDMLINSIWSHMGQSNIDIICKEITLHLEIDTLTFTFRKGEFLIEQFYIGLIWFYSFLIIHVVALNSWFLWKTMHLIECCHYMCQVHFLFLSDLLRTVSDLCL